MFVFLLCWVVAKVINRSVTDPLLMEMPHYIKKKNMEKFWKTKWQVVARWSFPWGGSNPQSQREPTISEGSHHLRGNPPPSQSVATTSEVSHSLRGFPPSQRVLPISRGAHHHLRGTPPPSQRVFLKGSHHLTGIPPSQVREMRCGPGVRGGCHLSSSKRLHPPSKRHMVDL